MQLAGAACDSPSTVRHMDVHDVLDGQEDVCAAWPCSLNVGNLKNQCSKNNCCPRLRRAAPAHTIPRARVPLPSPPSPPSPAFAEPTPLIK